MKSFLQILSSTLALLATATLTSANQVVFSNNELLSGWSDASYDAKADYLSDTITVQVEPYGLWAIKNPGVEIAEAYSGIQFDIKVGRVVACFFLCL